MAPKHLVAKYRGKCRGCGERIDVGEEMVWHGRKRAYHPTCFDPTCNPESNPTARGNGPTEEQPNMSKAKQVMITSNATGLMARCDHDHPDHLSALPCTKLAKKIASEQLGDDIKVKQVPASAAEAFPTTLERWGFEIPWGGSSETESKPKRKSKPDAAALLGQLQDLLSGPADIDEDAIQAMIDARLDERLADLDRPVTKRFETPEATIEPEEGEIQHKEHERLVRWISAGITRVWIAGPAGTGKTYAAEKIARALDLPVYVQPTVADEYQLAGYTDAHGRYQESQVYRWATDENPRAVLVLDEADRNDPQVTVWLNALLANGWAVFPTGQIKIAPTKIVIATANTMGHGNSLAYSAAQSQDSAFLSRFKARLYWDIDKHAEKAIARQRAPYESTDRVVRASQRIRQNLEANGIDLEWGPRRTYAAAELVAAGEDIDNAFRFAGLCELDDHAQERALAGAL